MAGGTEADDGMRLGLGERVDEGSLGLIHAAPIARAESLVPDSG
jgi:hypothetical protein